MQYESHAKRFAVGVDALAQNCQDMAVCPYERSKKDGIPMGSFAESINEYRIALQKGVIQEAYRGLMAYMLALRTQLSNRYPDYFVSGSLYYGAMDMTYFSFTPKSLQERKLKIAIVFLHEAFRFEAWLGGYNKQVQEKYWRLFKEYGWEKYHLLPTTKGADAIVECVIVEDPDFCDLEALSGQIESASLMFIGEVVNFLVTNNI
jgi:hypothetical protein